MTATGYKETGLSQKTMDFIVQVLSQYPIKEAKLFGSRAKGNFKEGSDIDICIITENLFSYKDLLKIKQSFEDSFLPYQFDILEFNKLNNKELVEHIEQVGKTIFRR